MGNNLHTYKSYDEIGRLTNITTNTIQDLDYEYLNGRLFSREDNVKSLTETFSYDNLDRLELSMTNGNGYIVSYDPNGNITNKSNVGDFKYEGSGPHAISSVENSTGIISELPQLINYTSFDKISDIEEGIYKQYFTYGPGQNRKKTILEENGIITKEKYFLANYEKEISNGNTRELHYINTPDGINAIYEIEEGVEQIYYVYKDHLGSPYCITYENGNIAEYMSFDAWGRRRKPDDWSYTNVPTSYLFDRGFTGHEHMPEFGLVNMNGRLYDPVLSRMLSPDNYIQHTTFSQSFNRYSYALNNPLSYIDPSGELAWYIPTIVMAIVGFEAGGYLSSGSFNPLDWSSEDWNAAGVGAIAGAGVGFGISSGLNAITGKNMGIFTSASNNLVYNSTTLAWDITANALITSNINMLSSLAQGKDIEGIFHSGLVGLGSGGVGGMVGGLMEGSSIHFLSQRSIKATNYVTSGLNGFGDRVVTSLDNGESTKQAIVNGLFGMAEGLYFAHFWGNKDNISGMRGKHMQYGSTKGLAGRYVSSALSTAATSVPGLGVSVATWHSAYTCYLWSYDDNQIKQVIGNATGQGRDVIGWGVTLVEDYYTGAIIGPFIKIKR